MRFFYSNYFCNMNVDFIIVGQGICGTWLSYYLSQTNASFIVIDNNEPNSSSKIAAGIINPVTGRRIVKTWMIDELLQHLKIACLELEKEVGSAVLCQKNIIDFFSTQQIKTAFEERIKTDTTFLKVPANQNEFNSIFHAEFGNGEISPSYLFNLKMVIPAWRKTLLAKQQLLEEEFLIPNLKTSSSQVFYNDIVANKIIFCDGISSLQNPFFKTLPFSFNKGESLLIEAAEIPETNIFKKGIVLAPQGNNLFWVGSNYEWNFTDANPSIDFLDKTKKQLNNWLKVPYKIVEHKAAIRPTNLERRPFVGLHPTNKNIGILNGMGTKGCTLAPYFAKQLVDILFLQSPIHPEATIERFKKILN